MASYTDQSWEKLEKKNHDYCIISSVNIGTVNVEILKEIPKSYENFSKLESEQKLTSIGTS